MPSIIDAASASATLELTNPGVTEYFKMRDQALPTTVSFPGSTNLDLTLFNVTATGSVKPSGPGTLQFTLYGMPKPTGNGLWLPLASSEPEPIGGVGELEETMWMVEAEDCMIFLGSGKLQGTFKSNVANHPIAAIDLQQHPGNIEDTDPLYVFAIGASFTPAATRGSRAADAGDVLCTVELAHFNINA